jgi:glycosyltransferase involved in cell wall biosynthesis
MQALRLAFVVQRYGESVDGGAEYHCRLVAEHLARQHRVEVFTTCARDYITWRNELPPGESRVQGIPVRRFRVSRPRDPDRFGRISERVFRGPHCERDELEWLAEQGPYSPALVRALRRSRRRFDYFLFFSYRYYHSYHGVQALADRALVVPTAERDPVIELSIFKPFFHLPRAIVYNSREEREMIVSRTGNRQVPGDVVGVGVEEPERVEPAATARFRQRYRLAGPYAIFIGRVDPNKGCRQLFHFLERYRKETRSRLELLLVGGKAMEIPDTAALRYAGFLPEAEKWAALAGAELLIMPSELESLSMVTLESWALGKPVLVNGRCDVLRGQCQRSNGGLYYADYYEFREALALLESNRALASALGRNGRRFFERHYRWEVIEGKYNRLLATLAEQDRARELRAVGAAAPRWRAAFWGRRSD